MPLFSRLIALVLVSFFCAISTWVNAERLTLTCRFVEGVDLNGSKMESNDSSRDSVVKVDLEKKLCDDQRCDIDDNAFRWRETYKENDGSASTRTISIDRNLGTMMENFSPRRAWLRSRCTRSAQMF